MKFYTAFSPVWLAGYLSCLAISAGILLSSSITYAFEKTDDTTFQNLIDSSSPALTILYTAISRGELYPCATCGETALGGLARRAFVFSEVRRNSQPVLTISGPDEILSDIDILRFKNSNSTEKAPGSTYQPEKAQLLLSGYKALGIDVGYLSEKESTWLKSAAGGIPPNFLTVTNEPLTIIKSTSSGKVGLILFPHGEERFHLPSDRQKEAVLEAGKKIMSQVSLVIGISPWGNTAEERFILQADEIFSILLGGGPGLGFSYSFDHSTQKLLWVRPENQGRAVNIIEIMELPPPGISSLWVEGVSFNARQVFLKPSIPFDPTVIKITGEKSKSVSSSQ